MNFVESGSSVLLSDAADTAVEATPAKKSTSNAKAFAASMVLALVVFPFTLSGMMSATNWVIDQVVIPHMQEKSNDFNKPLPAMLPADADATASANAADAH